MLKNKMIPASLIVLCMGAAGRAAVVTSSDALWPTDAPAQTVDVFTDVANPASRGSRNVANTRQIRQTFYADTSFTIGSIIFSANNYDGDMAFTIKIYTVANINATTWSGTGASQIGSTITVYAPGSGYDQTGDHNLLVTLTPSEQITLTQRNSGSAGYAIEVQPFPASAGTGSVFQWRHAYDGINHSEGQYFDESGNIVTSTADMGVAFIAVPETASLALVVAGMIAITRRRRT